MKIQAEFVLTTDDIESARDAFICHMEYEIRRCVEQEFGDSIDLDLEDCPLIYPAIEKFVDANMNEFLKMVVEAVRENFNVIDYFDDLDIYKTKLDLWEKEQALKIMTPAMYQQLKPLALTQEQEKEQDAKERVEDRLELLRREADELGFCLARK